MGSTSLGYNAPIVVYENKYYKYEDPDYSITDTPLSEQDLHIMSEAVEVLRQFKGFSYFSDMGDIVSRLEDHVTSAKQKTVPVIDFEKNESLKGLNHLDTIYHAIINKQVLNIKYKSFKARSASNFTFNPYLLKEYRNRWFVFGTKGESNTLINLALDRIHYIEIATHKLYTKNTFFDPAVFFDDLVGVTKNIGMKAERVCFLVDKQNAPYVATKPLHKSQKIIAAHEDGSITFEIEVIINQELKREIFGFADSISVLSPKSLVDFMTWRFRLAKEKYNA